KKKKAKKKNGNIFKWLRKSQKEGLDVVEFNHPGVIAENREHAAILFRAIEQLPENQKSAFVLQKVEGLSVQEIAGVLKSSEGAVESLLSRARANLKKLLREYY